jgi:LPXTG-motif cell wall-anchored protein
MKKVLPILLVLVLMIMTIGLTVFAKEKIPSTQIHFHGISSETQTVVVNLNDGTSINLTKLGSNVWGCPDGKEIAKDQIISVALNSTVILKENFKKMTAEGKGTINIWLADETVEETTIVEETTPEETTIIEETTTIEETSTVEETTVIEETTTIEETTIVETTTQETTDKILPTTTEATTISTEYEIPQTGEQDNTISIALGAGFLILASIGIWLRRKILN